jgi:hypothetical protein
VDIEQLQHFAFGDLVGGVGEQAHHAHVVGLDHHLERTRIEEVADEHARGVAPERIRGLAPAPQVGLVDDVVVQQRRGMDEFHDGGEQHVIVAAIASRLRRQQHEHRPQALAAAADDVLGNLVDQHDVGGQPRADQAVHARHVGRRQRLHVGEVPDGTGKIG